jgi:hypothetical protein
VRAYVDYGRHPGIYFSASTPPAWRQWLPPDGRTRLPYFHAEMSARHQGGTVHYESKRVDSSGPSAQLRARYGATGPGFRSMTGRSSGDWRSATASTWWTSTSERCAYWIEPTTPGSHRNLRCHVRLRCFRPKRPASAPFHGGTAQPSHDRPHLCGGQVAPVAGHPEPLRVSPSPIECGTLMKARACCRSGRMQLGRATVTAGDMGTTRL